MYTCAGGSQGGLGLHISSPPPLPFLGLPYPRSQAFPLPISDRLQYAKTEWERLVSILSRERCHCRQREGRGAVSTNKTGVGSVNHVPLFTNFTLLLAHTSFVAFRFSPSNRGVTGLGGGGAWCWRLYSGKLLPFKHLHVASRPDIWPTYVHYTM